MANGWGQPGQYQQGSGQQYPQQQPPWQPQPYSPDPHQRHFQGPPPGYGQVQPYAPLPPYQGQPQYAAPRHAPPVAAKSTAAGLILGLLVPGVGCMYAGRTGIGVLLLAIWLISFPLAFFVIGFVTGFCAWVISAVLGYTMTRAWNTAHGIVSLGRIGDDRPLGSGAAASVSGPRQRSAAVSAGPAMAAAAV